MISIGCRGLGIIFNLDIENQRNLFNFGAHLGIAFQIHDDILDFTQDSTMLGKPSFNDLREGIITAPIMFGLLEYKLKQDQRFDKLNHIINSEKSEESIREGVELLMATNGISISDKLSIDHIHDAIENLETMRYHN